MSRSKIVKAGGAEPDEFELSVATEFANLEVCIIISRISKFYHGCNWFFLVIILMNQ